MLCVLSVQWSALQQVMLQQPTKEGATAHSLPLHAPADQTGRDEDVSITRKPSEQTKPVGRARHIHCQRPDAVLR